MCILYYCLMMFQYKLFNWIIWLYIISWLVVIQFGYQDWVIGQKYFKGDGCRMIKSVEKFLEGYSCMGFVVEEVLEVKGVL